VPENAVRLLTVGLLALLYLFFLAVLQVVWADVRGGRRTSGPGAGAMMAEAAVTAAALVRLAAGGSRGRRHAVDRPLTLGRSSDCDILVDDRYVSSQHARVWMDAGRMLVEDLGSTNGTYVDEHRVTAPIALVLGNRLRVGNVVFEVSP
jgi:pSer/pThr/pTyr-binding forkhead associated (FHA) protein